MARRKQQPKELVFTGIPGEDFSSFLKSRSKPWDFGLELIRKYTSNTTLYNFLKSVGESRQTRSMMKENIKIISRKWLNK